MTESQKAWIDNASYSDLLRRWRHAKPGDQIFCDDSGVYYSKVMREKQNAISNDEKVAASKNIGW